MIKHPWLWPVVHSTSMKLYGIAFSIPMSIIRNQNVKHPSSSIIQQFTQVWPCLVCICHNQAIIFRAQACILLYLSLHPAAAAAVRMVPSSPLESRPLSPWLNPSSQVTYPLSTRSYMYPSASSYPLVPFSFKTCHWQCTRPFPTCLGR